MKPHYVLTPTGPVLKPLPAPTAPDATLSPRAYLDAPMTTANQIKHRLRQQGKTLKDFARENGFQYRTVSDVMRGLRQGNYGEGREVRLKLGLPVND